MRLFHSHVTFVAFMGAWLLAIGTNCAQTPTSGPPSITPTTTQPTTQSTIQPTAQSPSSTNSDGDNSGGWLDRISDRADQIGSIQADIKYDRRNHLLGDEQRRFGNLVFIAGPPARYAIHFNKVIIDNGRSKKQDRWYLFDGIWLVERLDDQKQFFKRQIVRPNHAGDANPKNSDPLAAGHGPFALPLTARKQQVLKKFSVDLIDPADDDPAPPDSIPDSAPDSVLNSPPNGSVHLRLTPLPQRSMDLAVIDIWYDRELLVPMRVRMLDPDGENEQEFNLRKIVINEPIDESIIDVSEPRGRGWLVEITPWRDGK